MRREIHRIADLVGRAGRGSRGRLVLALGGLALWGCLGAVGYAGIEGWNALDSLYMAALAVTTVGFTEVHPLSEAGRAFTLFYLAVNLGLMAIAGAAVTSYLVEGHVGGALRRQRLERELSRLSGHVILCGFGRMGCAAALELRRSRVQLAVIEKREEVARYAREEGFLLLEASAFDEEALEKAGLQRARGVICALGSDADNLTLTLTVRDMRQDIPIVGRATGPTEQRLMRRAGATHVISPYEAGGLRMATMVTRPEVVQFLDVTMHAGERVIRLDSIPVLAGSQAAGRILRETRCFAESGTMVVGLVGPEGQTTVNPPRDSILAAGSTLIVLGDDDQLADLRARLARGEA